MIADAPVQPEQPENDAAGGAMSTTNSPDLTRTDSFIPRDAIDILFRLNFDELETRPIYLKNRAVDKTDNTGVLQRLVKRYQEQKRRISTPYRLYLSALVLSGLV
jgi:hypothetical protein